MKAQKQIKLFVLVLALSLALTACLPPMPGAESNAPVEPVVVRDTNLVSATGIVVPAEYASMSVSSPGVVDNLYVQDGQAVKKDEALITLGGVAQAEAGLAAAQFELASAQQAYDAFVRTEGIGRADAWQAFMDAQIGRAKAEKGWEGLDLDTIEDSLENREKEAAEAKAHLDDMQAESDKYANEDNYKRRNAEINLEDAQENYNQAVRDLEEKQRERDTVRAALDRALAAEAEARHKHELTLDGPDAEQLALLEARLANAKAQANAAQDRLDDLSLLAPFAGTVSEVNIHAGEWAAPGQPIIVLADLNTLRVETTDLNEIDVAKIKVGDTASITFDAFPDMVVSGMVVSIAPKSSAGSGVNYTAVIELDEIPEGLRWGMTAFVDIKIEK